MRWVLLFVGWLGMDAAQAQVSTPFSPDATVSCAQETGDWVGCVGASAEACVAASSIQGEVTDGLCTDHATGRNSACPGDLGDPKSVFRELCYEYEANFWLGEVRFAIGRLKQPLIENPGPDVARLLAEGTEAEKAMTDTQPCFFLFRSLGYEPKGDWPVVEVQRCRARHYMASVVALEWAVADIEVAR